MKKEKEISKRCGKWWKHISTKRRKSVMTTQTKAPHPGDLPPLEEKEKTKEKAKVKAKTKVAKGNTKNLQEAQTVLKETAGPISTKETAPKWPQALANSSTMSLCTHQERETKEVGPARARARKKEKVKEKEKIKEKEKVGTVPKEVAKKGELRLRCLPDHNPEVPHLQGKEINSHVIHT